MRYYDIQVTDSNGTQQMRYTSHPNGVTQPPDGGACNVELDLPVVFLTPGDVNAAISDTGDIGGGKIRIWGIPLTQISQAKDLTFMNCQISGGMGVGLPLANSQQSGILVQGLIARSFGNWLGTTMTHDLIITGGYGLYNKNNSNLVHNWPKGTPLSQAIENTLKAAYPDYTVQMNISGNLVAPYDDVSTHNTLGQYADKMLMRSRDVASIGNYFGVHIVSKPGKVFYVYDDTTADQAPTKQIVYTDLVGQSTWIDVGHVQVTCVMRADISVGDVIQLKPNIATIQAGASLLTNPYAFQGKFLVSHVRHVGNYKSPDGASWITVITAGTLHPPSIVQPPRS